MKTTRKKPLGSRD